MRSFYVLLPPYHKLVFEFLIQWFECYLLLTNFSKPFPNSSSPPVFLVVFCIAGATSRSSALVLNCVICGLETSVWRGRESCTFLTNDTEHDTSPSSSRVIGNPFFQRNSSESEPITVVEKDDNGFVYFKCRFCGYTFNYMNTLRAHERIHDVAQVGLR